MEKVYGLTLDFQYIRNNGRILGETVFADALIPIYERRGKKGYQLVPVSAGTVLIDASLLDGGNDGRLRFTCAHELAHWVIDKEYFLRLGETAVAMHSEGVKSSQCNPAIERQANRMASRILMPKCTLKKGFHSIRGNTRNAAATLANVYEVSRQAMEIRFKELGLIY
jgi:hypothetical protein